MIFKLNYQFSILSLIIFLIGCNNIDNNCRNKNIYFDEALELPEIKFSTTENWGVIRTRIESNFEDELCLRCEQVAFAIPFNYYGEEKKIKVLVDYDTPYCDNCPIPMRLRQYAYINLSKKGSLIFEDEIIAVDSLKYKLQGFYETDLEAFNNTYRHFYYRIDWQQGSNIKLINQILAVIHDSHLKYVRNQNTLNMESFCNLTIEDLNHIQRNYPLHIELDLGKQEFNNPPEIINTVPTSNKLH